MYATTEEISLVEQFIEAKAVKAVQRWPIRDSSDTKHASAAVLVAEKLTLVKGIYCSACCFTKLLDCQNHFVRAMFGSKRNVSHHQ